MQIKRGPKAGGMSDTDALALKTDIEARGGTVTMAGSVPTVAELQAGIGTITSLDTSDATAIASVIYEGYTAYANGEKITGTAPIPEEPTEELTGYTEDLTANKTYFASSSYDASSLPAKAFDNGTTASSIWYGAANTSEFVGVDFGEGVTKRVEKIRLFSYSTSDGAINGFIFQGSNNFTDWTSLYTGNRVNNTQWQDFTFTNANGYRYYRILQDGAPFGGTLTHLTECEMMEGIYA